QSDLSPEDVVLDDQAPMEESAEGDTSLVEMDADVDMDDLGAEADPDEAPPNLPDEAGRIRIDVNYKAFTTEFDEVVQAEELCEPEELLRLRGLLDQQLLSLQHAT